MPTFAHLSFELQENVPLAPYTTFRIGGPARYFCRVTTPEQLLEAVHFARMQGFPLFVLGGGSNLLVGDAGYPGVVIHATLEGAIETHDYRNALPARNSITYKVPAGVDWDAFVLRVAEEGISGIECLAGIPGLVGASPIQNIGAYGQEVASSVSVVHALDLQTLEFVTLPSELCGFAYRSSIFNTTHRNRYVVTAVTFRFDLRATPRLVYADLKEHFANQVSVPQPLEIYHAVREIRHRKGMLLVEGEQDCRSAGSFFKNPIVPVAMLGSVAGLLKLDAGTIPHWAAGEGLIKLPAAWLLERAGFTKGFQMGNAGISSRHTLALINRGGATAAEVEALRDRIRDQVRSSFGIELEQEPVLLGA